MDPENDDFPVLRRRVGLDVREVEVQGDQRSALFPAVGGGAMSYKL